MPSSAAPSPPARSHPRQLPDDRARRLDRHHRPPPHPPRPRLLGHRALVGAERLHAHLRRAAAARRARRRPARPPPDVRRRHRPLHRSRRSRPALAQSADVAARRARRPGRRRRDRGTLHARAPDDELPRGPRADARGRVLRARSPAAAAASGSCSAASSPAGCRGAGASSSTCRSGARSFSPRRVCCRRRSAAPGTSISPAP